MLVKSIHSVALLVLRINGARNEEKEETNHNSQQQPQMLGRFGGGRVLNAVEPSNKHLV